MIAVIISLVYAAFTGQLNITGTSVNRKSNWDIHFENLSTITTTGSAKVLSQPTLNGTTSIEDYSVSETSPGDTISFTFKVVNDGNYNASISSVSVGTPECSGTDTVSNTNVCGKLSYTLTYDSGSSVQVGDELFAKDYVIMKVTLTYAEFNDDSLLPTQDVSIGNLGITIIYQQSGSALVDNSGEVANNRVYHKGEKLTFNNEDYYIIANSGADKDYVIALKDEPLTFAEATLYGAGHVNSYTNSGNVNNWRGYGGVAYYSSETCGYVNGSWVYTGCVVDYVQSDIKYVVDAWAADKFQNNELKEVDGYSARLISKDEYIATENYSWRSNSNYWYCSMTPATSYQVWGIGFNGSINGNSSVCDHNGVVRPVINVKKSALESNNNNNNE